jgi:TolB-like protein/Tfp pilus assembly protein PilF
MAPEQLLGEAVDARSDLFAVGILLYELATGRRPFGGETSIDISHAILRGTPEPIEQVRRDLPDALEQLVARCLEKDPRKRIQTALEINNELRRMRKATERAETAEQDPAGTATIAVLPFVNRSASADDEYFSDGLADELINVLAKIKGLRVSARTSSFHFKGKDVALSDIGKALNVATILEGSVRKAGNRVRISVQLVKVEDGFHLWSETYDRTFEDIFAVQDDIAHSVVKELRSKLMGEAADSDASGEARAEVAKAARGRAADPEAYRLFLQARHLLGRRTKEDVAAGIQYLKEALELDPEFALAWKDLGSAYSQQAGVGWIPREEGFEQARQAVERALSLEPDLAEGHASLGWIRMNHDWDWRGAEVSFSRALELEPGNARVLVPAGVLATNLGRLDEGISLYRRAAAQDPLRASAFSNLGLTLDAAGRHGEAEVEFRRALMLAPLGTAVHSLLSMNLATQGRGEEALRVAGREPEQFFRLWALAIVCHMLGRPAESEQALKELLENWSDEGGYQIAAVFAARGDADAAFEWLERAYAQRDPGLCEIKSSPPLRSLHVDPRWAAFLRKMGFDV